MYIYIHISIYKIYVFSYMYVYIYIYACISVQYGKKNPTVIGTMVSWGYHHETV